MSSHSRSVSMRTCVGCRGVVHSHELLRIALKDGAAVPDPDRAAGGRGAWVHPTPECVELALRKRALNRAFRCEVSDEAMRLLAREMTDGRKPKR
ncbi:YlxR family protein [Trueperella bernardiae]|uniref:YlxR family protein n=2 Tax=Trueperella bernardiae TaxID=59561 RepID=UPI0009EA52AE